MKKKILIPVAAIIIIISGFIVARISRSDMKSDIMVDVSHGEFIVDITNTGELEAKNSVPILGPRGVRRFRIWNLTIQNIVEEGTVVKKGEWIATLDKSEIQGQLQEEQLEVEQRRSQYIQTQLDTSLVMRQARDELINLAYAVEEKEIQLEQSKFEPPAVIKQAEIDLEKAKRALNQAEGNYKIKTEQNIAKMQESGAILQESRMEYEQRESLLDQFTISAPEEGMVIYVKGWDGKPVKAGSQVSAWDPVVASLPDLSRMLSKTYINEVDVRKVKIGQIVEIGLDAFPDKRLAGKIINVANVGEQIPNSDSKVFLATIEIDQSDSTLRPSMTTSNRIIIQKLDNVISIPLECLHTKNDSITFVYKKVGLGIAKQEVKTGTRNNNSVIIDLGLNENDKLFLSIPESAENDNITLLPELDGKRNLNKEAEVLQVVDQPRARGNRGDGKEVGNGGDQNNN